MSRCYLQTFLMVCGYINMDLREVLREYVNKVQMTQNRVQWRDYFERSWMVSFHKFNDVVIFLVPTNFSRKIMYYI